MTETSVRCKDCVNLTDEKPAFCTWLNAEISANVAIAPTDCEGFFEKGHKTKGDDRVAGETSNKTSLDKRLNNTVGTVGGNKESRKNLPKIPKTLVLRALELKSLGGDVYLERVRCGRKTCHCQKGLGHGPYEYLRFFQNGKGRKKYLGKGLAVLVSKSREELLELLGKGGLSETSSGKAV